MNAEELREGILFRLAYADEHAQETQNTSPNMHFRIHGGVMLDPNDAISLWNRMVALPNGEQMRCHTPNYGIRLNFGDGGFYTAAICWECNNISISSSGDYSWQTFDGQSKEAQSLLSDIREYVSDVEPAT